jgi:iron complex outermembrane receptor protein
MINTGKFFTRCVSCVVFFAAVSVSGPGLARQADGVLGRLIDLPLEELLDLEVSVASAFPERDIHIGSVASVVTRNDWKKRNARRLHDALGHLPSVMLLPSAFGADNITIRGYADSNNVSGVAALWDGVPLHTLQSGGEVFDRQNINLGTLDKIEVIRGPASALHGEDAFHGVMALTSFQSQSDIHEVDAELASNGYHQADVRVSNAVGDKLRLSVSGAVSGQPDQDREYHFITPTAQGVTRGEREYNYQSTTAVMKLATVPDGGSQHRFSLYVDDNDSDDFASQGSDDLGDRDQGGSESTFYMAKYDLNRTVNARTDMELTGYYWTKDHEFDRNLTANRMLTGIGHEYQWGAKAAIKQKQLFENTQWSATLGTRFARIRHAARRITSDSGALLVSDDLPFSGVDRRIYSLAVDASSTFLDDKFHLRYGGRIDDYSDFGTQETPRLGLLYHPNPRAAFKLLYGHAFRAPIAGEIAGFSTVEGDPDIRAETIDTYELVYMQRADRWKGEVVLFRSEWKDAIGNVPTTTPGFFSKFANTGHNEAEGVELSGLYQFEVWLLDFSSSYVRSENTVTGADYTAFPKWIINLGVGYTIATKNIDVFVNNRVHLGATATTQPGAAALDDYWRTDLNVTRAFNPDFSGYLAVRNLFNRENYLPSVQDADFGIPDEEVSASVGLRYLL